MIKLVTIDGTVMYVRESVEPKCGHEHKQCLYFEDRVLLECLSCKEQFIVAQPIDNSVSINHTANS